MKVLLLIVVVLFCFSNLCAQTKLTQEEYAVYASVLKTIYKENRETYSNKSEFVFINETKIDPELDLPSSKKYKNLIADFNRKNSVSGIIEKKFPRGKYSENYYLVSQTEVDKLLEEGRSEVAKLQEKAKLDSSSGYLGSLATGCAPFYEKYPESSGHYTLSRVGFSGQLALMQIKGDICWNGFSRNYILRKVKGNWKIVTVIGSDWIS